MLLNQMNKTTGTISIILNLVCIVLILFILDNQNKLKLEVATIKNEASSTNSKLDYVESDINKAMYVDTMKKK